MNIFNNFCVEQNLQTAYKAGIIVLAVLLVSAIAAFIIKKIKSAPKYTAKDALLTQTEIKYFDIIRGIIGDNYIVYPQINLASVIEKEGAGARTELFRNIDFGVFDYNYKIVLLIEINDATHLRKDRKERDKKVARICKKAKIPLVTFWVKDGINVERMRRALADKLYI